MKTFTQTDRQTDKQDGQTNKTDRQTRQTFTQTNKTDRQICRQEYPCRGEGTNTLALMSFRIKGNLVPIFGMSSLTVDN